MTQAQAQTQSQLPRPKRVLLIARDYMFYTRDIAAAIRSGFDASVRFFPVEPVGVAYKLTRYCEPLRRRWLARHHQRLQAQVAPESVDIALFIHVHPIGELLPAWRRALPDARFVLYSWDSLRTHNYLPLIGYFDRVMTFDRGDSETHARLEYLPLFFSERFVALRGESQRRYDLTFIGTAFHARRYDEVEKLRAVLLARGIRLYDYVLVSPVVYLRSLAAGKRLRRVHFRSMRADDLVRAYGASKAILDLANNLQSGYTMRTFEALGAHRKLVTTRASIVREDFFTPESVLVLDDKLGAVTREFLDGELRVAPCIEQYSLTNWLRRLMPELTTKVS
jgi:hypothetical protein